MISTSPAPLFDEYTKTQGILMNTFDMYFLTIKLFYDNPTFETDDGIAFYSAIFGLPEINQ